MCKCRYEHLAKSAATIFDDSLSADAYLNVLYMPSTFPRSESSRQSRDPVDNQFTSASSYLEDGPRSNLDSVRYAECIHYLHEVRLYPINMYFSFCLLDQTLLYSVTLDLEFSLSRFPVSTVEQLHIFLCRHLNHAFFSPCSSQFPTESRQ